MKNNIVIITGGGTGGHLSIAKVLIDKLKQKDTKVIYVGSLYGSDKKWFENYENIDNAYFLNTKGVVNQSKFGKLKSLILIFIATIKALRIIIKHKVTKVISVGGYSASPASFASYLLKKDFYIHEQNSVMGKLNLISSRWAKEIFGSYKNVTVNVDYPVDDKFFINQKIRKECKTIIFLGGSQGAKSINDFVLQEAVHLINMGYNIIHQAGINHIDEVKKQYEKLNLEVDCFGFSNSLFEKLKKSDIAVCRAGAGTIWELSALGIPALYVPYPYAASNHQYFNAKFIEDKNLGKVVDEKNLQFDILLDFINSDIENKSKNLIKLIKPNGINKILDIVLE